MLAPLLKFINSLLGNDSAGTASTNLRRQNIRLILIAVVIFFIINTALGWFIPGESGTSHRVPATEKDPEFHKEIHPSDLERSVQQARIDLLAKQNNEGEELVEELKDTIQKQEEILRQFIEKQILLEEKIKNVEKEADKKIATSQKRQELALQKMLLEKSEPSASKSKNALRMEVAPSKTKTTKNYIPAGSFFDATMIGGVDVSTAVSAQHQLRPVLFYITDIAKLPNMQESDIQSCHILCGAYGDLSSERAYIRTEQLSCVKKSGKIIDIPIEGFVTDETGKDGVRGTVVMREGDMLTQAFFAAGFASLGSLAEAAGARDSQNENIDWKQSMQSALIEGGGIAVKKSASRLEDYLIKRLEAISPIIQIQAGRQLNIVITKGFFIDEDNE